MRQAKQRRKQQQAEFQARRNQPKLKLVDNECMVPKRMELATIKPLTKNQSQAFKDFNSGSHLLLDGFAGTGKTFLACYFALKAIEAEEYERVIIIRSARSSLDQGFMPGNAEEKMAMFEDPYIDSVTKLYDDKNAYKKLKDRGTLVFTSTSFLRGVTLDNAIIILDEAQNLSEVEADTVATRQGDNSRLLVLGDTRQTDYFKHDRSGYINFVKTLRKMSDIAETQFQLEDIVRSGFVKDYLTAKYS